MRDNKWLFELFSDLWDRYFFDVRKGNILEVKFSRVARTRLGSIRMTKDKKKSVVLINGVFKDPLIPAEVVEAVLAHELVHYVHGFCSPLKRRYKHPHKGGVVREEMVRRGLGHQHRTERAWTRRNLQGLMIGD